LQSVSKFAQATDGFGSKISRGEDGAAERGSSASTHSRVRLLDCASSIYDCSVALLGIAIEECKGLSAHACQSAIRTIVSAWRSDFEAGLLREGNVRYGNEFGITSQLMAQARDQGHTKSCISGSDIVAVGYVSAAAARNCLAFLIGGSSSKYHLQFQAFLSTFFQALFLCDNAAGSVNALRDAASRYGKILLYLVPFQHFVLWVISFMFSAFCMILPLTCALHTHRNGLEMPMSASFLKSCLVVNGEACLSHDLRAELLKHLNSCVSNQEGSMVAQTFLEQILGGGNQESHDVDALVTIASAIVSPSISSGSACVSQLTSWIFRRLAHIPFLSISHKLGSPNDAAVATISSLCRNALFEYADVDLCTLCMTVLHQWIKQPPPTPPFQLVSFFAQPLPPISVLCSVLQRASPSLAITLSPAVTTFFASFFAVPELPNRGLHLLINTLKTFSADQRSTLSTTNTQSSLDFLPVISAILHPTQLCLSSVRLASELCVRWDVRGSTDSSLVLRRSAEVQVASAAAAAQAAASGNQRDYEDSFDLQCCSFVVHARHASVLDMKLFESVLERFLGFTGTPTPSLLAMTCLAACLVLDSYSSHASDAAPFDSQRSSENTSNSSEFASGLSRDKQFEVVTDAVMALLRACRAGADEGGRVDSSNEALLSATTIVKSIAAKLALKASRIDMVHSVFIHECYLDVGIQADSRAGGHAKAFAP
jgi:hypothetical protein